MTRPRVTIVAVSASGTPRRRARRRSGVNTKNSSTASVTGIRKSRPAAIAANAMIMKMPMTAQLAARPLAPVPSGRNRGKLNFWAKASPCIAGRAKRDGQPGRSGPPAKAMPARQIGWSPVASITRVGKPISPSSSRKGRAGRSSTLTMVFTSQIPRATRTAAATGGTPAV